MQNKAYWFFKYILIGPWLRVYNRPFTKGLDKLPKEGAGILASNHLAVMDSFYLPLVSKRQLTFLAKKEYFTTPGLVGGIQKFFFSSVGQVPIDREDKESQNAAMGTALKVLERGDLLGMYPEGTRSPDGRLYRGKTGLARCGVYVGDPIDPDDFRDAGDDYAQARALTDAIMEALHGLSGQEYVKDFYAADVKKSLEAGKGYPPGSEPRS